MKILNSLTIPPVDVNKLFCGRNIIYTDYEEINVGNIEEVVEDTLEQHWDNLVCISQLRAYERNNQPIRRRSKGVRPEINNRICENHAHEIKEFKKGYVFGQPITFVQHAGKDASDSNEKNDDKGISALNEYMFEQNKFVKDLRLADDVLTGGIGNRLVMQNNNKDEESPFEIVNLDPAFSYVVRCNNFKRTKVLGVSFNRKTDGTMIIGAYTDSEYFELTRNTEKTYEIIKQEINGIGMIPIIEYENDFNRMGCFEVAIPLLNALNMATSDRLNGLAQFVQSFVWMNNVKLSDEQFDSLKEKGCLLTADADTSLKADVKYLTSQLNQNEVQSFVDDLYDKILQITGVPGREQSTGGNTGQAIMLSNGWQLAETQAQSSECVFGESEHNFLKVCLAIIKKTDKKIPKELKELKVSDIDIKFSRNKTDSLLVKTQGLLNQLNAGIHPRIAIKNCDLYSDPQQVWADSADYLEKWIYKLSEETNVSNGEDNIPNDVRNNNAEDNTTAKNSENKTQSSTIEANDV